MGLARWLVSPWRDPDPDGQRFDEAWGTETCWLDRPDFWATFSGRNYEPTPVRVVEQALDAVPGDLRARTLVDLGSGKGRVVLLASGRPFRRVVGIEHRPALHAVAERNRAAFERASAAVGEVRAPIHLLCGDAADHPLPEGPLVVWLFNPFGPDVLGSLLERLGGRDVVLVYVVPVELPLVQAAGFRAVARGGDGDWPWQVLTRPPAGR